MKKLVLFASRRARLILYVIIALVGTGIYVYRNTPVEQFPYIELPIIAVSTTFPQAPAEDLATLVIEPLAEKLELLDELDRSKAFAYPGSGEIILTFAVDADLEQKLSKVRDIVNTVNLPEDSTSVVFPVEFPRTALLFSVTSNENRKLTRNEVTLIKREVLDIEGAKGVDVLGARKDAIVITVDHEDMNQYKLSTSAIRNAIMMHQSRLPIGAIDNEGGSVVVNLAQEINQAEDFQNVVLFSGPVGRKLLLSDVADIALTDTDEGETRIDGQQGNVFIVRAEAGTDMKYLSEQAEMRVLALTEKMGLKTTILENKYQTVEDQLKIVLNTVASTLVLIVLLGTLVLGIVDGLLVGCTIPLAFIISLLTLSTFGYTFNFPVLFGVLFATGMVVDSSIVIIEWGASKISRGASYRSAFYDAAIDMALPIIVSVGTTLSAFLPLFFLSGIYGEMMRPVSITAAVILCSSLLVSFLFIPPLGRYMHEVRRFVIPPQGNKWKTVIGFYTKILDIVTARFSTTAIAAGCVLLFLIGSALVYTTFGKTPYFMKSFDSRVLEVVISAPSVVSTDEETRILKQTQEAIQERFGDKIMNYQTSRQMSTRSTSSVGTIGSVYLYLKKWKERGPSQQVSFELEKFLNSEEQFQDWDLDFTILHEEIGPVPLDKRIDVNIYAYRTSDLEAASKAFTAFLDNLPSADNYHSEGPPEILRYNMNMNFRELSYHQISPRDVGEYAALFTGGLEISHMLLEGEEIPIILRVDKSKRTVSDLRSGSLISKSAHPGFPLAGNEQDTSDLVPITYLSDENFDKTRLYTLFQDGKTSKNFRILPVEGRETEFFASIKPWIQGEHEFDADFKFAGNEKEKITMTSSLIKSFVFAVLLMLFILMLLFNSLYQSLLVLTATLFSIAGVALGLTIFGFAPSIMMTGMAIIFLAGIVVNDNIILLDRYNKLLREYHAANPEDNNVVGRKMRAIRQTVADRFRPIVFTSTTTILGVLPAAVGVNLNIFAFQIGIGDPGILWYQDMAVAIVLGLSTASFVTLFSTPVMLAMEAHTHDKTQAILSKVFGKFMKYSRENRQKSH